MSKQDKVTMLIEKIISDGTITRVKQDYFPDGPAKPYIKGAMANYEQREGQRLLSVKINDQDYWDLDPSTKNPPPEDKPRSTPLW